MRRPHPRWRSRVPGTACLVALALASAAPALAVTCHCFRDRAYDPRQPAAVEPYLKATASNSLLSAVTGVPKGDLVRALMGGTAGPDLWVAHTLAPKLATDAATLLKGRSAGKSWPQLLAGYAIPEPLQPVIAAGGESGERLPEAIVRDTLQKRLGADPADLAAAERSTGSYQELTLAVLASRWTRRPAGELAAEVKEGKTSWGALLHAAGIPPDQIDTRLPALLTPGK